MLLYGLEVLSLSKQEIMEIQRTETNIIKSIYGLPKTVRHKALLAATNIDIDTMIHRYETIKSSFMLKVLDNSYTKVITEKSIKMNSFNVIEYAGIIDDSTITEISKNCNLIISENIVKLREDKSRNDEVTLIPKAFKETKEKEGHT